MSRDERIGVDDPALDDAALEALAEAHATAPPPALRDRLLAAAAREARMSAGATRPAAVDRGPARWRLVGSVAAVVALALGGLLARAWSHADALDAALARIERTNRELVAKLDAQAAANADLVARLEAQTRAVSALRDALAGQGQVLAVLAGPSTRVARLAPQGGGAASGRVLVDPATGDAAVVAADLATLDAGKIYELWAIRGSRAPEPAGLFATSTERATAARMPRVDRPDEVTAFAVSIEPAGGSTSPTGTIVLAGPLAAQPS